MPERQLKPDSLLESLCTAGSCGSGPRQPQAGTEQGREREPRWGSDESCTLLGSAAVALAASLSILDKPPRRCVRELLGAPEFESLEAVSRRLPQVSRLLGAPARLVAGDWRCLEALGTPALLLWCRRRFVVLVGGDGRRFILLDPASRVRELALEQVASRFSGLALSFDRCASRPSGKRRWTRSRQLARAAEVLEDGPPPRVRRSSERGGRALYAARAVGAVGGRGSRGDALENTWEFRRDAALARFGVAPRRGSSNPIPTHAAGEGI